MEAQMVLLEAGPGGVTRISSRCFFRDEDAERIVFVVGIPIYHYDRSDRVTERFIAVSLVDDGLAKQAEVARAFGVGVASVRRWQSRYGNRGLAGLARKPRRSPLLKMGGARDRAVRRMFEQGTSNAEMSRRLGVSESTINRALKRLGLERQGLESLTLELNGPSEVAVAVAVPCTGSDTDRDATEEAGSRGGAGTEGDASLDDASTSEQAGDASCDAALDDGQRVVEGEPKRAVSVFRSADFDPTDRKVDREFARQGLLEDAEPLFGRADDVTGAGVLLAIPLIGSSGVLDVLRDLYGRVGSAFYGVRTMGLTLLLMALLRIKRPESLKEHRPTDLGRALGLDRAPEVKTVRRRLGLMAKARKGALLMRELGRRRLQGRENIVGFLYVDGHVREYNGKGKLAKAHVTRRRISAKAATDTWVNDCHGDPLFLVTSEVNAGLTKMLEPVLDEVQELVGRDRRVTVVFDRGGWSPKLFARLVERNVDILTYRKGRSEALPKEAFQQVTGRVEGQTVSYELHEMSVRMGTTTVRSAGGEVVPLWMRQVTRLRDQDGHQTQVLTTRQDLDAAEVLWRMFNRWRQENFLKYMRQEYAIDGLVDYSLDSVSSEIDRPNPERSKIDKAIREAQAKLKELEREYGAAAMDNKEALRPTMRGFKIANGQVGQAVRAQRARVDQLKAQRDALPKRVPASELQRQSAERKLITDAMKMTAYQIESDLVRMVDSHYARTADEGRKLIVAALKSPADIDVTGAVLRVTLAPQSSLHRTRAIAALCEELNSMDARFPGSYLRMRYAIREA
jgi:transposase